MDGQKAIEIITNTVQTDSMTVEQDKALAVMQRATEKQVAKSLVDKEGEFGDRALVCPTCGCGAVGNPFRKGREIYPHCPWCGQKLDTENKGGADHGKG